MAVYDIFERHQRIAQYEKRNEQTLRNDAQQRCGKPQLRKTNTELIHVFKVTSPSPFRERRDNIQDWCEDIFQACTDVQNRIHNLPKYKFVVNEDIIPDRTKEDLAIEKKKTKSRNVFANMRLFKEVDCVQKLSTNMAFGANRLIKQWWDKKPKSKRLYESMMKSGEFNSTQRELLSKAQIIMDKSEIQTQECLKSINKFNES